MPGVLMLGASVERRAAAACFRQWARPLVVAGPQARQVLAISRGEEQTPGTRGIAGPAGPGPGCCPHEPGRHRSGPAVHRPEWSVPGRLAHRGVAGIAARGPHEPTPEEYTAAGPTTKPRLWTLLALAGRIGNSHHV